MLRFLSTVLDGLGSITALLSPVCIIHWLIEATRVKMLEPLTKLLDPLFYPLNELFTPLFESLILSLNANIFRPLLSFLNTLLAPMFAIIGGLVHSPNVISLPHEVPYNINVSGESIPITQGLLGLVFTLLFFACSFGSQMLKAANQRMDVVSSDLQQRRRLEQLKAKEKKQQRLAVSNRRLMVYIQCNFLENGNTAPYFDNYAQQGGRLVDKNPVAMVVDFENLDRAFHYCLESASQVIKYYNSLRPIDPQPPFHIGIHAYEPSEAKEDSLRWCRQLIRYAGSNQIIFAKSVKELIDAQGQAGAYRIQPQGYYQFDIGGVQETFRLDVR